MAKEFKELKKAFWYGRNSTDNQEGSRQQQWAVCSAYAKKKNYQIVEEFYDFACSGTNTNRPQFQQMMNMLKQEANDVHYIICYSSDRISRNIHDSVEFEEQLERYDCVLVSVTQPNFNDDSAEARLARNIQYSVSQYHVDNTRRLVKRAMLDKSSRAEFNGGIPCYGLRVEGKHYAINEAEAEAVQIIFSMIAENARYKDIAKELNDRGFRDRNGKMFTEKKCFCDIIRNPRYKGDYIYGRTFKNKKGSYNQHVSNPSSKQIIIPDAIPAIVSKELWKKANDVLDLRRKRCGAGTAKEYYLLSNKIKCYCGCSMHGNRRKSIQGYEYITYRCSSKDKTNHTIKKEISRDNIEGYVVHCLKYFFEDEVAVKILTYVVNYVLKNYYFNSNDIERNTNQRLKSVNKKISNILNNLEKTTQDTVVEALLERLEIYQSERTSIESEIATIKERQANTPTLTEIDIREILDKSFNQLEHNTNRRKIANIIGKFIDSVIVYNDKVQINFDLDFVFFGLSNMIEFSVVAMRTELKKEISTLWYSISDIGTKGKKSSIEYKIKYRKGNKNIYFQNGVHQEIISF